MLRDVPARRIVAAVADAAARWTDADFAPRVRTTAAIEARLGYTTPVVDYALDRLFGGLTAAALEAAIVAELGAVAALDGFVAQAGRPASWARGVRRVTIAASDTTIGVAVPPLAFALCAKCDVVVKDRSDLLVAAFVRTLGEELPECAAAVDVRSWAGGDVAVEAEALGAADVVVAFGGTAALRAIRAACDAEATFVPFGHRASAGYLDRTALDGDLAPLCAAIARDALLYDGDGCLSLHVLYVERSAPERHRRLLQALAQACAATTIEFPPGQRDPQRAASRASFVARFAFNAAQGRGALLRACDGSWAILDGAPLAQLPALGGGVLPVVTVDGPADARAAGFPGPFQAVGVPPGFGDDRAAALAVALGAVRVAPLGTLQDPPLAGRHGGRSRIGDFVRWIDRG